MRRTILAVVLIGAAAIAMSSVGPPQVARAQAVTCFGQAPTITQTGGTVSGTGGADVIVAVNVDVVHGLGGDDRICVSWDHPDNPLVYIYAGSGNDSVQCSIDQPTVYHCLHEVHGGSGNDVLRTVYNGYGGSGNDVIQGFLGSYCDGGSGKDTAVNCDTVVNVP
jgi:Ca2+-binding RTX toxin-like protein